MEGRTEIHVQQTNTAWDEAANELIVFKTREREFDFAPYAAILGRDFTVSACNAIKYNKNGIKVRTWQDNYVASLERILVSLVLFLRYATRGDLLPADFSDSDWEQFCKWYRDWLEGRPLAPRTIDKHIRSTNTVLLSLLANKTIPWKLELPLLHSTTRAKQCQPHNAPRRRKYNNAPQGVDETTQPFRIHDTRDRRVYDFSGYVELGNEFTRDVVKQFNVLQASYASIKALYKAWAQFASFLLQCKSTEGQSAFFLTLASPNFRGITEREWEQRIYLWRDKLANDAALRLSGAHGYVQDFRSVWSTLSQADIVPAVSIKGFKNGKKYSNSQRRKVLSQLARSRTDVQAVASKKIWERLERFFDTNEKPEASSFIQALSHDLPPDELASLTVEQTIERIYELNSKRLATLRRCAEQDFSQWYSHWQRGNQALQHATRTGEELVDLLESPLRSISERRRNSGNFLYHCDQPARLGNALAYVLSAQKGITTGINGRFHHLSRAHAKTRDEFHAYLHPHPLATAALWVLTLVDTGANCEVARLMPCDCLTDSNSPTHKRILLGAKQRAGGKVIYDELPILPTTDQSLSLVQAITQYKEMTHRYRELAADNVRGHLLLREEHRAIDFLTEYSARDWFKRLISQHPALEGLRVLPSMIRPSVLMEAQHHNSGNVVAAQILADHASASTTLNNYTGRTPVILKYSLLIREFQERFQTVIIASIDGAAQKLGLTEEEFRRIFSEAARTGLGVACLNPTAGIQPGTRRGETCTRQDSCWGCNMRWVVATRENIADLVLFNQYLKTAQDSYAPNNPERWEKFWLPWLVFSDIALSKLALGETAQLFEEGRALAADQARHYTPIPLT